MEEAKIVSIGEHGITVKKGTIIKTIPRSKVSPSSEFVDSLQLFQLGFWAGTASAKNQIAQENLCFSG